jgi:hypothetical protein
VSELLTIEWVERLGGFDWRFIDQWGYETPVSFDTNDWYDTRWFPEQGEGEIVEGEVSEGAFDRL